MNKTNTSNVKIVYESEPVGIGSTILTRRHYTSQRFVHLEISSVRFVFAPTRSSLSILDSPPTTTFQACTRHIELLIARAQGLSPGRANYRRLGVHFLSHVG